MTIEFRPPRPDEVSQLRWLFTESFGDAAFTELFFSTGFSLDRCLIAAEDRVLASLHWFDCTLDDQRAAYLYGIAAFAAHRGRGIGSDLIRAALDHLKHQGYGPILLVPAEPGLFRYYERFGFRPVSAIREETVAAGDPLPIRKLTTAEYAEARRKFLPAGSLMQEGPCLDLLAGYADFYTTGRAVAAVTENMVWELLGEIADAPGLIAALHLPRATVRTPGPGRPFAMGIGVGGTIHLGLALD